MASKINETEADKQEQRGDDEMSDDESESDNLSVVLNESVEEDIPPPADEEDLADDESNQPTAESTATEDHEDGIDDTNDSVGENNNQTVTVKFNYPHPLIKQIKQEIMEEIITNEKTTCRQNKRVNASSPSVIKKKKMKRETLLGTNSSDQTEVDPPDTIDVTCGHLRGILHKELFYCPGIHRACVEMEDGSFVTPKKFMFMGEKARLKDWKNAIRWNGHQLRKHIEAGTLHFYKHDELCTGRCMARSPFASREQYANAGNKFGKNEKFEFETLGFTAETEHNETSELDPEKYMTTVENGCMKIQSVSGGDHAMWNSTTQGDVDEDPPDIKPDVKELQIQMMKTMQAKVETVVLAPKVQKVTLTNNLPSIIESATFTTKVKPTFVSTPVKTSSAPSPLSLPPSIMNAVMPPVSNNDSNEEEDRLLWQGIVELGLIDEFFREIKASLDLLKNTMVKRLVPIEDSNRISTIVRQLGLMQKLKFKLEAHRTDMDRQRRRLDREMMDLQRRVKEYEQKKKLLEKKSECFDQLLEIPTIKNNSAVPMMVYSNQSQTPTSFILTPAQSSNASGTVVFSSQATTVSNTVTNTLASNGRITAGPGGSKILVFPKQNTEFFSSPEGGLKITLKRKNESQSADAHPSKQAASESQLKKILTSATMKNTGNSVDEQNSVEKSNEADNGDINDADIGVGEEDLLISENVNNDEQNSSVDDLNSSHEELTTNDHIVGRDQKSEEKNENPVKRSKRKRSAKTYTDFIK